MLILLLHHCNTNITLLNHHCITTVTPLQQVKVRIDSIFSMAEAAACHSYLEGRTAIGKVLRNAIIINL
jgi:NADPH:quinone reductase-like Zn-dependent oxidoreductase